MPALAAVDKVRSPSRGQFLRRFIAAIMVIAAADQYRRKGQRIARVGAESHQMLRADFRVGNIRRRDQKCAGNLCLEVGNGVNGRWYSERMRDQQHRFFGRVHGLGNARHPILAHRL